MHLFWVVFFRLQKGDKKICTNSDNDNKFVSDKVL